MVDAERGPVGEKGKFANGYVLQSKAGGGFLTAEGRDDKNVCWEDAGAADWVCNARQRHVSSGESGGKQSTEPWCQDFSILLVIFRLYMPNYLNNGPARCSLKAR